MNSLASCESCGLEETQCELDQTFSSKFKVLVCKNCIKEKHDLYGLVPKSQAKIEYMLTEEELADKSILPHYSKPNPKSPRWSNMQLYLKKHLSEFAIKKWGTLEQIQVEKLAKKQKSADFKIKRFESRVKDLRKKTRLENSTKKFIQVQPHSHTFEELDVFENGRKLKKCKNCGFSLIYEDI